MSTRPLDDADDRLLEISSKDGLLHSVISSFGLAVDSVARATVGNNNSSFIVTVCPAHHLEPGSRIGNIAGTYPIPPFQVGEKRRVVFTSALIKEDYNAALMSANKVAAMKLVHDAGGYASSVTPHVYGWSEGRNGKSWCLMEYMPGVLWEDLDTDTKVVVVRSIARVLKSLQEVPIPPQYGAFAFENNTTDSKVVVGETCFHYGGPYKHVRDLYAGIITNQWGAVVRTPRLHKWSGSSVRLDRGEVDLGDAVEHLVEVVKEDGLRWREMTRGMEYSSGLVHGDFMEMNFLVDPDTFEFTALLDFEFAQAGPPIDEYFQSLPSQGLIYLGMRPGNLDPEGETETLQKLLQGATVESVSAELQQKAKYIAVMKDEGVYGPWSMNPDVLSRQANLYWFGYELCNGPFQRESFWTSTDERSVKRRERMLKEVRGNLEWDVKIWD